MDRTSECREADAAIASLGIRTPGPAQQVLHLSGGNQQKVVLAKWLAAQAEIFIFDEPTRGIDVAARHDIYLLINHVVEQGAGVIMISSDLPEVLGMSDRVLVMRAGAIEAELAGQDLTDAAVLQAAPGSPRDGRLAAGEAAGGGRVCTRAVSSGRSRGWSRCA